MEELFPLSVHPPSLSAYSEWEMLLDRREIELKDGATYAFDLDGGMSVAWDCQKEAGAAARITFDASRDNIVSLMVKRDGGNGATTGAADSAGNLVVREETTVPEFDRSHAENHSTWALRVGVGGGPGGGERGAAVANESQEMEPQTGDAENGAAAAEEKEEQYETVGYCRGGRSREMDEDSARETDSPAAAAAAAALLSFENQATLKIRETPPPPPPLPPKRNGRKMNAVETEAAAAAAGERMRNALRTCTS